MTEQNQIYKCAKCGNIVEVLHPGGGELVCCGEPMARQIENTVDAAVEKHVPVIEKTEKGVRVKVGSVPHPMEEAHYIEWIEILADGKAYRKYLKPGDAPEAEFCVEAEDITAREYCNLHGLWKS
ncbi:MAG: desulfoferrodoxin [Candidatus Moranbacteria bacterium]|nr:desulfoferrodoxin [Candidatus Moranbacteria bacterium]